MKQIKEYNVKTKKLMKNQRKSLKQFENHETIKESHKQIKGNHETNQRKSLNNMRKS